MPLMGDQSLMSCSERAGGRGILAEISHSLVDCCGYSGTDGWNGRNGENTLSFSPRVALHSLTILKACLSRKQAQLSWWEIPSAFGCVTELQQGIKP